MTGTTREVRAARAAEQDAIARTLVRAFADDPLLCWVLDRDRRRPAAARRFFLWHLAHMIEQDVSWTTDAVRGAAVWALPGQWQASAGQQARLVGSMVPAVRHPITALRGITRIEAAHPREPHLYLALLGVGLQRYANGANTSGNPTSSTRFLAQLTLKGLSNVDNGLVAAFRASVQGYTQLPGQAPPPSRFTDYQ